MPYGYIAAACATWVAQPLHRLLLYVSAYCSDIDGFTAVDARQLRIREQKLLLQCFEEVVR